MNSEGVDLETDAVNIVVVAGVDCCFASAVAVTDKLVIHISQYILVLEA